MQLFMRLLFIYKNKISILGLVASVLLPASCLQKDAAGGNKPEGNEMVVNHRNDTVTTNDTIVDIGDDSGSATRSYDPRTIWFLQNLHVAMDNAGEQTIVR